MRYRKNRGWMITCLSALQFNKFASVLRYHGILIYAGFGSNSRCAVKQDTVVPTKSDSDDMFCLQSYQELVIDKSLVY